MALGARGGHQVGGMAIPAGSALVVEAVTVTSAWVRAGVAGRRPGAGAVACAA